MTQDELQQSPNIGEASHGQRRIWAAEQSSSRENAQIVPLAYRIEGAIDADRLELAISAVVTAHEALHSGLVFERGRVVRRLSLQSFKLEIADLRSTPALLRKQAVEEKGRVFFARHFDLSSDLMLRALLVLEAQATQFLLIAIHHSAGDGASFDLIQQHISRIYSGETGSVVFGETLPFSDYVSHVRAREQSGDFDAALTQTQRQLATDDEQVEPQLRQPPPHSLGSRFKRFEIGPRLHRSVVDLSTRHFGLGAATVYLTAFHIFLAAMNNQPRTVIGFPVSNRAAPGHENIVGFVTNIVTVVLQVDTAQSLDTCFAGTRSALISLRRSFDLPYGLVLQRLHGDPFRFDGVPFQALLTYQPRKTWPLRLAGCTVSAVEPVTWPAPFEFMLDIEEGDDGASALLRWNASRQSVATIEVLAEWYPWLLEQLCHQPNLTVLDVQRTLQVPFDQAARTSIERARAERGLRLTALREKRNMETT